jgi:hypothetical protein
MGDKLGVFAERLFVFSFVLVRVNCFLVGGVACLGADILHSLKINIKFSY